MHRGVSARPSRSEPRSVSVRPSGSVSARRRVPSGRWQARSGERAPPRPEARVRRRGRGGRRRRGAGGGGAGVARRRGGSPAEIAAEAHDASDVDVAGADDGGDGEDRYDEAPAGESDAARADRDACGSRGAGGARDRPSPRHSFGRARDVEAPAGEACRRRRRPSSRPGRRGGRGPTAAEPKPRPPL